MTKPKRYKVATMIHIYRDHGLTWSSIARMYGVTQQRVDAIAANYAPRIAELTGRADEYPPDEFPADQAEAID